MGSIPASILLLFLTSENLLLCKCSTVESEPVKGNTRPHWELPGRGARASAWRVERLWAVLVSPSAFAHLRDFRRIKSFNKETFVSRQLIWIRHQHLLLSKSCSTFTRMKEKKGTDIERQLMIRCDTDTQGQNSNRQESGCWTLILSDCPTLEGRRRRRKEKRKTIHSFVK